MLLEQSRKCRPPRALQGGCRSGPHGRTGVCAPHSDLLALLSSGEVRGFSVLSALTHRDCQVGAPAGLHVARPKGGGVQAYCRFAS